MRRGDCLLGLNTPVHSETLLKIDAEDPSRPTMVTFTGVGDPLLDSVSTVAEQTNLLLSLLRMQYDQ